MNHETTTTPTNDSKSKALDALREISNVVYGERGAKRKELEAAKAARREERLRVLLEVLTTGNPSAEKARFNARFALLKAVSATRAGATSQQLKACDELLKVAPWNQLIEPVTQFAIAKNCSAEQVQSLLAGLGIDGSSEGPSDAQQSAQVEMPATASPKTAKARSGRAVRGRKAS